MPDPERVTTDGLPPDPSCAGTGAPRPINFATGQHGAYWVLSEAERAKGFVRPVRDAYVHVGHFAKFTQANPSYAVLLSVGADACGAQTKMSRDIAETYAANPAFYGNTFCVSCRKHLPVEEFVWEGTTERVGS